MAFHINEPDKITKKNVFIGKAKLFVGRNVFNTYSLEGVLVVSIC